MTSGFATSDYAYDLPEELIAQDPLADRASSRLMVLDRKTGAVSHHHFSEIASFLQEGDLLVLNDTRVIPARLIGVKADTGAQAEVLLLRRAEQAQTEAADHPAASCVWECLVKPGKKLREGAVIWFPGEAIPDAAKAEVEAEDPRHVSRVASLQTPLRATVLEVLPDGNRIVRFTWNNDSNGQPVTFEEILDQLGEMPLPPYIKRKLARAERDRYNTVYAKVDGSAAAPTAGLHFTPELLDAIRAKGVRAAAVTLHVGLGTFRPVKTDDVRNHHMHSEWYHVPEETARLVAETKASGGRVICVGTTSCRTLESWAARCDSMTVPEAVSGETDIFIYPGYAFKVMDGLITNFHLPESTLLMLVSAFAGRERVLSAYREAVREQYRFFSFGDVMLVR